ncbi:trans-sulfuration enzyme family protein [Paraliobacillus salinarum]|uniref:trans-sulfuration enzyme family protein n=1 Tax=Paraliobacillus salinarum TaxID=1158996 RepID=UPI0015F5D09D|nr:aminotransferase class I/II-fold pyridoxal phosphate-dependent enzyme [Paraliobacillus salinarum]
MKSDITKLLDRDNYENMDQKPVVPPIYQNTLFTFDNWEAIDKAYDDPTNNCIYTRGKNPSNDIVERKLAELAHGEKAKLFSSGMSAISAALFHYAKPNGHIIAIKNIYGPANNFIQHYLVDKMGMSVTFITGNDLSEFEDSIKEDTCIIYLESPSSVVFSLQDLEGVSKLAKKSGIKTVVDNTWATPLYQKPLDFGVDMEVHSCSKYLGGHSDIVAGIAIGSEADIDQIYNHEHAFIGGKMSPFESWLLLRSLRTLHLRMNQHQKSGMKVANFLENHPEVSKVYYPGLDSFDQADLAKKQMTGFTSLMSFELVTQDLNKIKKFVNSLKVFQIGVSWGGFESLVYVPAISYLKEMSPETFKKTGLSLSNIRISVGLEDSEDIISDLNNALEIIRE